MRFRYLATPSILGLAALLLWLAGGAVATYYPGDLVVASADPPLSDETIDIAGSILIQAGGSVDWTNVTVIFNSSASGVQGLYIDGAADFTRVTVTGMNGTPWWFMVNATGSLVAEQCDFGWMNGTATDPGPGGTAATTNFYSLVGGVQIYSNFTWIGNSTIHDGRGTNIYVGANTHPRINHNRILDARYIMFEYASSYSAPRQTSDFRAVAACVVLASGAADLDRSHIERCGADASANITDPGSMGATAATSNIRLVAAGVVALGGNHTLRLLEIQNVTTGQPSTRSFAEGPLNVTHNLLRLASWGVLLRGTSGVTVAGGYIASADTAIEVFNDAGYVGGPLFFEVFALTVNGTYLTGITAAFSGFTQTATISVDSSTFASGGNAAVNVYFSNLQAAHTASLTGLTVDLGTASGTGIQVFDASSAGKPTITVSSNTVSRVRAPVSIGLTSLTGGAAVTASSNAINNTAGIFNGSVQPGTQGGVDVRWVSLLGGNLAVTVEDNRIYNQTWQVGAGGYPGITLSSNSCQNLVSTQLVRRNVVSNASDGIYLYDNYPGVAMAVTYNVSANTIQTTTGMGIRLQSFSTGGSLTPAVDRNFIDRQGSYGIYFTANSPALPVPPPTFGNNTIYGQGTSRCCGMYFQGPAGRISVNIADTMVNNVSYGMVFSNVNANVYRSNVTVTLNGTQCSECSARFYDSDIYELSALVSGGTSDVIAYQRFGSPRVQWQGDGGILIAQDNLQLDWLGPGGWRRMATTAINATGAVPERYLDAWRKPATSGEVYKSLVPSIRVGEEDIQGASINYAANFWGNITIFDPELPSLTFTTPGAGSQVRARSVIVKGFISDRITGVEAIQLSVDGQNFTNASMWDRQTGAWEHTVTFPSDGVFTIVLHGWDRARWAITFGDFSSNYREVNITGIVVDTQPPRVVITDPTTDFTTRLTSYTVRGFVSDTNSIALFQFSYGGRTLGTQPDVLGVFVAQVTNLTEGPNLISVLVTDAAGNTNVTTRTIVVDTVPPHLNIYAPLNNSFTNRAAVDLNGDVEQDVVLTVNGVSASFPYTVPLKNGVNQFWVNATDRGLNVQSVLLVVTLDRTPPTLTFTSPVRFPFYTRDPHVIVTGLSNEALASLVVNQVTYPLTGTDPRQFAFELYLEDGQHTVLVHVTDLANNSYEVNASPIVVDTQPPSLRLDSPPDKSVTDQRTVTFTGRTDPGAFLNVTDASGRHISDINPVTGAFSYTDTRVSDGVFPYTFEATDAVGNVRAVVITITIDTTRPNLDVASPDPTTRTESEVVNFRGTVGSGATLLVTIDSPDDDLDLTDSPVAVECTDVVGADCLYNFNVNIAGGQTVVTLVATDLAGNQQVREVFVSRTVEAVAPPPQNAPYLAIIGAVLGLATLPVWIMRFRAKAHAEEPGVLPQKERTARTLMPAPQQQQVIVEEEPHDMYAQDALSRRGG